MHPFHELVNTGTVGGWLLGGIFTSCPIHVRSYKTIFGGH